ncbi:MAG TPA: sigma-70 family RNA polymerase sigma factor [Dehalococcoidia bacterium]|nr:sigma-70 family RNA polymerase sigma factor [Dehalococcoidia bacterium]
MPINANQQTITQRYIAIDGQQIPVTEEVYRAYKRPLWAEHKRKEREKRCYDKNGNRCTADCSKCDKQRTGSILSLDKFTEEGFEVADHLDLAELVASKLLLEELYKVLEELDPDNRRIMELFSKGKSEREIATDIGLSQKAVNKRKSKLFAQLYEHLKAYI